MSLVYKGLNLGELIDRFKSICKFNKKEDVEVVFDFEHAYPCGIGSYRGYYDELAIGFDFDGEAKNIHGFLKMLKDSDGKIFTGYNGGEYKMFRETPVWVANYGNCGSTVITEILDRGKAMVLMTGLIDDNGLWEAEK